MTVFHEQALPLQLKQKILATFLDYSFRDFLCNIMTCSFLANDYPAAHQVSQSATNSSQQRKNRRRGAKSFSCFRFFPCYSKSFSNFEFSSFIQQQFDIQIFFVMDTNQEKIVKSLLADEKHRRKGTIRLGGAAPCLPEKITQCPIA